MGRRAQGFVLVAVVILAALTVPHLAGVRVAGEAIIVTVPTAPRVGDCQRQSEANDSTVNVEPAVGVTISMTVSCGSLHDTQVISMTYDPGRFPTPRQGRPPYPDLQDCAAAADAFLAIRPPDSPGDPTDLLGPWRPASIGTFRMLRPTALQLRAGQDWLACQLLSPQGPVTGSATGVFSGPARGNPLALCHSSNDNLLEPATPCGHPHALEILGWNTADEPKAGQLALDKSCGELAERMTGMTDPTLGGDLRVAAVDLPDAGDDLQAPGLAGDDGLRGRTACTVSPVGSRLLVASLTGVGAGPVPWA